ncbi:MAG: single-stranded-DNA-specific exonuclease RecJ [Cryomorphaceae bacterium]|nr:MAG: single-stranded-DNA-specific exonuclease RecJ [Cryomorphaceae bacterium]
MKTLAPTTRWNVLPRADQQKVDSLKDALGIDRNLCEILVQRGITSFEEARSFFRPDMSQLHDPFLMADMEAAVERVIQALGDGDRIMVYGDYDVDGTTSVAVVYSVLRRVTEQVEYYIPNRYTEGYGLSKKGIDTAKKNGVSLIITLDCGVKAVQLADYCAELGIDLIVCDHHRPGAVLPRAVAVLDPKREDCAYPYKELCGCGVGFKLMQALSMRGVFGFSVCMDYVDLVALAIGADIVPITGENRVLAALGLEKINNNPGEGIRAILQTANFKRTLSVSDVVFVIAPRINAAGRMESGNRAVELLVSSQEDLAALLSETINGQNLQRRELDQAITAQALQMIQEDQVLMDAKTTVLFHPDWHKGVIGIVASRLTETYYRPTIILTESNGKATGSARSVKDYDVYNAIEACSDLLDQFGGHAFAAGLTLPVENIVLFRSKFEEVVSATIRPEQLIPEIEIDLEIDFADITPRFFAVLKQMAPFGPGNMNPVFITRHCINAGYSKTVGSNHLKFHVCQTSNPGITMNGIGFGLAEHYPEVADGQPFSLVYTLEENEFNGRTSLQLKVKDIRFEP